MESICLAAKPRGAFSGRALSAVYGAMSRGGVDFTRVALALLDRDEFTASSIYYLGNHARTEEAFQALSRAVVGPNYDARKQAGLKRIRERIVTGAVPAS